MTSQGPQTEARSLSAFVGRDRELADLRAGLSDVSAGRSHLLLLSGEPGIGKIGLADEFRLLLVAQGVLAWGRCWEGGGLPAYWPWIQVLRTCPADTDAEQRAAILGSEATSFVLVSRKIRSMSVELFKR